MNTGNPAAARLRHWLAVVTTLAATAAPGCLLTPTDGEDVSSIEDPLVLAGLVPFADATQVRLEARNWRTGDFDFIGQTQSDPGEPWVADDGEIWTPFNTAIVLDPPGTPDGACHWDESCEFGRARAEGVAQVRASMYVAQRDQWMPLSTFDEQAIACAEDYAGDPWAAQDECQSESPFATVSVRPAVAADPRPDECIIELGEDGETTPISVTLAPGETTLLQSVPQSSFVRSTSGACHFQVFNHENHRGRSVTFGTGISSRVRVGTGAFESAGETWRARSMAIHRPVVDADEQCEIRVGSNGASMTLFKTVWDLPWTRFVRHTKGRNCRFNLHSGPGLGGGRTKVAFPGIDSNFEVGYMMRSLEVSHWRHAPAHDPCFRAGLGGGMQGRCLPTLEAPAFENDEDLDGDDLGQLLEDALATAFAPVIVYDSSDASEPMPPMLYRVAPDPEAPHLIHIRGALLWPNDPGYGPSSACIDNHAGDFNGFNVRLRRIRTGDETYYVPTAVSLWRHASWQDGEAWDADQGEGAGNRGFDFEGTHPRVYLSGHKKHPYNDTGFNEQSSSYSAWSCNDDVDGLGPRGLPRMTHLDGGWVRPNNVGSAEAPLIFSVATVDERLADYDLWSTLKFCGAFPAQWCLGGKVLSAYFGG